MNCTVPNFPLSGTKEALCHDIVHFRVKMIHKERN